ncbi:MAG: hypothetical protein ACJAVK_002085 [Akkermansiaceae bacterium]|jgi:hypothetical protein
MHLLSLSLLLAFLVSNALRADLTITEFVADNDGSTLDEDGDASDWIEINNAGPAAASTAGLSLTDNQTQPTKWQFPDIEIPPGGSLTVFASGKDRRVAGSELHTNFSLSAGGEYLALIGGAGALTEFAPQYPKQFYGVAYGSGTNANTETETLVPWPTAATWLAPIVDLGDAWQEQGFDDSTWSKAQTGIGFGYHFPGYLGAGGDTESAMLLTTASALIRIPFDIDDPAEVVSMTLALFFEDGFAAYLNGSPVAYENTPGPPTVGELATGSREVREGDAMTAFPIDFVGKLVRGENILAFHLLNRTAGSSDVLLVPKLTAETRDLSGGILNGYLESPTPGFPNANIAFTDFVADTIFNVDRGFFDAPFDVTISSATPGATIVYTTNGDTPTLDFGTQIAPQNETSPPSGIVNISTTTPLRVAAFKSGQRPTNVDTQTYLFIADVADQPTEPEGYPLPWITRNGNTIGGDYDMDLNVVGPIYSRAEIEAALLDLPTISIVTDIANLFDQQTGIQVNPVDAGAASERPVSIEMLGFEDDGPVQLDAGMRMNGNASRNTSRPKHNFRIAFRNEYGAGRLNFPLFGAAAATERFNQVVIRGGNGNSWVHPDPSVYNNAMYIRDQWFRDAYFAMGHPEALQREVHVYFNGIYWGMHHLFERIEEEWAAERFGGQDDDWEGFRIVGGNNIEVIKGTPAEESSRMLASWQATLDAAEAGDLSTVEQYLDLDSYIDYVLLNFHAGNADWDQNNVRAMRRINPPGKYLFFCHDAERAGLNGLGGGNLNINVSTKNTARAPTAIHFDLRTNANSRDEYAIRFADRAYNHLFNDGALTPENGAAQWAARADGIREAMKAESARWGDAKREPALTLVNWEAALQREYTGWFPLRTPVTLNQLRATNVYPDLDPPTFSQQGGSVPEDFELLISSAVGTIYYTTDGSDPRQIGGTFNPAATMLPGSVSESTLLTKRSPEWRYLDDGDDMGTPWREVAFDNSAWATGNAPLGFGTINGNPLGGPEINPDSHLTVYFRRELEVAAPQLITRATVEVMSDGGAIVYLNGIEIARDNMPDGNISFETPSLSDSNGDEGTFDSFTFPPSAFVAGANVIAVELHNRSAGSSDMGLDLTITIIGTNPDNTPVPIDIATTVSARSYDGGEWSALNKATFITNTPASAANLVISEIFYNPPGSTEVAEYVELLNLGDETISLAGVAFVDGIAFTFPDDATLAAGRRLLVVADPAAFAATFGPALPVSGTYSGQLDNGGEVLTLIAANGDLIASFRYNDRAPWPLSADLEGRSLTMIAPLPGLDASEPSIWRSSVAVGGSPGRSDTITFTGSTSEELLAYASGGTGGELEFSLRAIEVNGSIDDYVVVSTTANLAADDALYDIQFSSDLDTWQSGSAIFLGPTPATGSVTRRAWRAPLPISHLDAPRFSRLRLSLR